MDSEKFPQTDSTDSEQADSGFPNRLYREIKKDLAFGPLPPAGPALRELADVVRALCREGGDPVRAFLREQTLAFFDQPRSDIAGLDFAALPSNGRCAMLAALRDAVYDDVPLVSGELEGPAWQDAPQSLRRYRLQVGFVGDWKDDVLEPLRDCLASVRKETERLGLLRVEPGAAPEATSPLSGPEPEIILTEAQHEILVELSRRPTAVKIIDLAAAVAHDRKALSENCKALGGHLLVSRVGKRKGVAITQAGRDLLKKNAPKESP